MPKKIVSPEPRRPHFIKAWMKFRDLNQDQVAEILGTSKQSVSRIASGIQPYTQDSLEAFAIALQCTPGDLTERDPASEPEGFSLFDLSNEDRSTITNLIKSLREKGLRKPSVMVDSAPAKPPASRTKKARA